MKSFFAELFTKFGALLMIVGGLTVAAMVQDGVRPNRANEGVYLKLLEIDHDLLLTETEKAEKKIAFLEERQAENEKASQDRFRIHAIVIAFGSVLGAVGVGLRRLGKRLSTSLAEELERVDPRPPILLLRSFSADTAGYVNEYRLPGFLEGATITGLAASLEPIGFEEMLAEEFRAAGPLIAIGRPGETLPPVGAARRWLGHDEWKSHVSDYLTKSQLVVMILGSIKGDDGLAWELRTTLATVPLEKVLFIIPPVKETEAEAYWADFQQRSSEKLPQYVPGTLVARVNSSGEWNIVRFEGERFRLGKEYRMGIRNIVKDQLASLEPRDSV